MKVVLFYQFTILTIKPLSNFYSPIWLKQNHLLALLLVMLEEAEHDSRITLYMNHTVSCE
jgi:hypothetical protein